MKKSIQDRLPAYSATKHPLTGETVLIKRGEKGFFPWRASEPMTADEYNLRNGITPEQEQAMLVGSIFGFHVPDVALALDK